MDRSELSSKLLAELRALGRELNIRRVDSYKKDELIDKIHSISRNIKDTVNHAVNKSSRISEVEIMKEPFQKTASMKIRRFLYKKSSNPDAGAAEGETHNSQNKK